MRTRIATARGALRSVAHRCICVRHRTDRDVLPGDTAGSQGESPNEKPQQGTCCPGGRELRRHCAADVRRNLYQRRAEQHENRAGYVWVPGVWHWNHGKHEWVAGHQVAERKGYHYENDRWVK